MKDYEHLHLSQSQLQHLLNELNGHNELYWLRQTINVPLDTERVRDFRLYNQLSWLIHKIKPCFSSWLQKWLALYFTIIFSDGFESNDFSAWTGTAGAPATVNTIVFDGNYSMFNNAAECCYETIVSTNNLFARAYIYIDSISADNNYARFIRFRNPGAGYLGLSIGMSGAGGTPNWELGWQDSAFGAHIDNSASAPAQDGWHCWEIYHQRETGGLNNGEVHFWYDDVEVADLANTGLDLNYGITRVEFGAPVDFYGAIAVYVDSCVIADTYIGLAGSPSRRLLRNMGL